MLLVVIEHPHLSIARPYSPPVPRVELEMDDVPVVAGDVEGL